jgi:ribA/ribD-fused uncharacterized protein
MKYYEKEKVIAFYGYKDYLSNHYVSTFSWMGHTFHSAEQAFMWFKAVKFSDYDIAHKLLSESFPPNCKWLGRQVSNFNEAMWTDVKGPMMEHILTAKFAQSAELQANLLNTGDYILVEASLSDNYWGVGMDENNPDISDNRNWKGGNVLGHVLMNVREMLR